MAKFHVRPSGQYRFDPYHLESQARRSREVSVPPLFHWVTFDVNNILPNYWQQDINNVALAADFREFPRTPVVTREATEVPSIPRGRVHAAQVQSRLPWLRALYRGEFRDLAARAAAEGVAPAADERYGVVLNVQRGPGMRFEAHVDSNPLTGLLFCTDHPEGGGELCIGRDPAASGVEAIERNCTVIRPHAGHLILFDGRMHPHYARPLVAYSGLRVLAVMNYYTESSPESTRPRELNHHLYGDPI